MSYALIRMESKVFKYDVVFTAVDINATIFWNIARVVRM
jgi:hypothetical protein